MIAGEDAAAAVALGALRPFAPRLVRPPVLQPAALYLELAGEDLRTRAFLLAGADGEEICLRPEMTAPVVRAALAGDGAWTGDGFALAYDGLVFRRAADAALGACEQRQVGAEWFAPAATLTRRLPEIVAVALEAVRACGAAPELRLGDAAIWPAALAAADLSPGWTRRLAAAFARPGGLAAAFDAAQASPAAAQASALADVVADLALDRAAALVAQVWAGEGLSAVGGRTPAMVAARLQARAQAAHGATPSPAVLDLLQALLTVDAAPEAAFAALERLAQAAPRPEPLRAALAEAQSFWRTLAPQAGAIPVRFSPGFGRGLAYYDGPVFEISDPRLGADAALGGGGRYDGLLAALARAEDADATGWGAAGFALRPDRLARAGAPA